MTPPTEGATPELPLTLYLDGNLGAVDLVQRLALGGLRLSNAADGSSAVIGLAEGEQPLPVDQPNQPNQPERSVRVELWQASGICHAVRCALSSAIEFDETELQCALEAAGRIIDDVAAQLEVVAP